MSGQLSGTRNALDDLKKEVKHQVLSLFPMFNTQTEPSSAAN